MSSPIGENIRFYRKKIGMKQVDLARKLNISSARLSNFEFGKNRIDADMLADIAKALDVSVDELVGVSGSNIVLTEEEERIIKMMRSNSKYKSIMYDIVNLDAE